MFLKRAGGEKIELKVVGRWNNRSSLKTKMLKHDTKQNMRSKDENVLAPWFSPLWALVHSLSSAVFS